MKNASFYYEFLVQACRKVRKQVKQDDVDERKKLMITIEAVRLI